MSTLDALKAYWVAQGISSGDPASAADLQAFEARYRVRLPPALRLYFAELNGIRRTVKFDEEMDADMIRFWPLGEVHPLSEVWLENPARQDAASLFVLADQGINACLYVAHLSNAETMAPIYIIGEGVTLVADSFEDFLDRYLAHDPAVLCPPS